MSLTCIENFFIFKKFPYSLLHMCISKQYMVKFGCSQWKVSICILLQPVYFTHYYLLTFTHKDVHSCIWFIFTVQWAFWRWKYHYLFKCRLFGKVIPMLPLQTRLLWIQVSWYACTHISRMSGPGTGIAGSWDVYVFDYTR